MYFFFQVTTREASIKGDDEEPLLAVVDASKQKDELTGTRRNIEEMRKEGGDNWLSLLNQQQNQV